MHIELNLGKKDIHSIYIIYVDQINKVYNLNLTVSQCLIYAELLYLNYKYSSISERYRLLLIYNAENKRSIAATIGVSSGTLNNTLTLFKTKIGKHGALLHLNGALNSNYIIDVEDINSIKLIIELKPETSGR